MILHTDKASQETYYQRFYQNAKRNYSLEKIESILPVISNIINDFSVHNIDELMEKYNRNE